MFCALANEMKKKILEPSQRYKYNNVFTLIYYTTFPNSDYECIFFMTHKNEQFFFLFNFVNTAAAAL